MRRMLALAALAVLALAGTAQANTPRMTRAIAIQAAEHDLLGDPAYAHDPDLWAQDGGLIHLTLWRLSANNSDEVYLDGVKATSAEQAASFYNGDGHLYTVRFHQVWHRFRWRYTGHCTRVDRATLECPIRLDLRWVTDRYAWPQYAAHRPPSITRYGRFRAAWTVGDGREQAGLPRRTVDGVRYVAKIIAGSAPDDIGTRDIPTPRGYWYEQGCDTWGWGLLGGPSGDHAQCGATSRAPSRAGGTARGVCHGHGRRSSRAG